MAAPQISKGRDISPTLEQVNAVANEVDAQALVAASPRAQGAALAYVANAATPASLVHDTTYDVPTTAAASTIALPAATADGTVVRFLADGTKNGHTVQYLDATGSVALTTALLASKRHLVVASKLGGKWFANAYVSP